MDTIEDLFGFYLVGMLSTYDVVLCYDYKIMTHVILIIVRYLHASVILRDQCGIINQKLNRSDK